MGPILAPLPSPDLVQLSPVEQLGKQIFFDAALSNPPGYACATCHMPKAGFTGSSSPVNHRLGTMPGVLPGRFGRRKPQAVSYAAFSPRGPYFDDDLQVWLGGNFWDGRAPGTPEQARMPFVDPNESANIPLGPYPPFAGGYSPLVAEKFRGRPYAQLFEHVYGPGSLSRPDDWLYSLGTAAIAAYEASPEVNQFSSKYDASPHGSPPAHRYVPSRSEENGRRLFFGKAQCSACHSSATLDVVLAETQGRDAFTMYCFANIGVPRSPKNPFYDQTNPSSNPYGYNPDGGRFRDYGLGSNPNPSPEGTRFFAETPGDLPRFRGLFKAPSVRNVDSRPAPGFAKAYMHNGAFDSLEEVVHFYNKRNVAVDRRGHERAFDLRTGPPPGYARLFPPPEILDNVQNVAGATPDDATSDVESNGQVGNLGLTPQEEGDVVSFLRTLTDGFSRPTR